MARNRWSYSAGSYGAKVRVAERRRGSNIHIYWQDPESGNQRQRSLKLPVRNADGKLMDSAAAKAKRKAAKLSNRLLIEETSPDEPQETTVGKLVDEFRKNRLRQMNERRRQGMARELDCIENFLGSGFVVDQLSAREWDALIEQRQSGRIDSRGREVHSEEDRCEVSLRTVTKTLKALRQVCRFGTKYRREDGAFLLEVDPTRGFDLPRTPDPHRPRIGEEELRKLLEAAPRVHPYLRPLLVLGAETGRRIGSIVALRWEDWTPEPNNPNSGGRIHWRADSDKIGQDWVTPFSPRAAQELERHRKPDTKLDDSFIFPAPSGMGHLRVDVASRWWNKGIVASGEELVKGRGFHSLRRRFANVRRHLNPHDVAYLGGWISVQTLQQVYQWSDYEGLKQTLNHGRSLPLSGESGHPPADAA